MRLAEYIQTVESDEGDVYDVFTIAVPRASTVNFSTLDLSIGTLPNVSDSRAVAKPVAAETQAVVASGRLVLA